MEKLKSLLVVAVLAFGFIGQAPAAGGLDPAHKVVIQVSTGDEAIQTIALNNAINLQNAFGMDNVQIEVVAYGPGLGLLTRGSALRERVESLAMQQVGFSACSNTMKGIEKKTGKKPALSEGVQVVPGGVAHIVQLQEQGYQYIRP